MSHKFKIDVEYMPTLTTGPGPEKTRLEVPRNVFMDLIQAQDETANDDFSREDVPDVSTDEFVNPAPKYLEPTKPSLQDDELSLVDLDEGGDDWIDVDSDKGPAVGRDAEEADWESVDLASAAAECDLAGEDKYSIETFRSSKKKEDLSMCLFSSRSGPSYSARYLSRSISEGDNPAGR